MLLWSLHRKTNKKIHDWRSKVRNIEKTIGISQGSAVPILNDHLGMGATLVLNLPKRDVCVTTLKERLALFNHNPD